VFLTYFCHLGYLCNKNYQIWWRSDEVLTKTSWVIFFGAPSS